MDVQTKTFSGAGSHFVSGGIFFTLLETTSAVDLIFTSANGSRRYKAESVEGGFSVDFFNYAAKDPTDLFKYGFNRVEIVASGANTVKFGVSKDGRGSFNQFSGSVTINKDTGLTSTADDSVAATTTEQVLAANSNRRYAILKNPSANAAAFKVGDSSVGAARGIRLQPGESIELWTTAAIHAYNVGGAAQVIELLEITT